MKPSTLTLQEAHEVTQESKFQLQAWIYEGKLETLPEGNELMITKSSLKSFMQARLIEKIKLKFQGKVLGAREFLPEFRCLDNLRKHRKKTTAKPAPVQAKKGFAVPEMLILAGILGGIIAFVSFFFK